MPEEPIGADQFLGENGALQDGWQGHLSDEDAELREDKTLAGITDIQGMARTVVAGQKTIGQLTGAGKRDFAILPDENSTPEEIGAHHTKMGRPDTVEGYDISKQVPEGVPKDEKFMAKMGQVMFDAGTPKNVADAILKGYNEHYIEHVKAMEVEDKIANTKADQQLHQLLGSAYEEKMKLGNFAINAIALPIDADFAATLTKEMPYDPLVAQMMIKIGEMINEDPGLKEKAAADSFTPADAIVKANEIMADPYYVSEQPAGKERNKALHDQLVEKVKNLFEMANQK